MECVIGYIKISCAGTAAWTACLKHKNCGLTMMLFTNRYKNHSRVFSWPSLTSVKVSKRYSKHIRRYRGNKFLDILLKFESKYLGELQGAQRRSITHTELNFMECAISYGLHYKIAQGPSFTIFFIFMRNKIHDNC